MKKYGIYLAYPPTVDLRHEGLGRYLAEFLKGAQEREDVRFVIACPSWMQDGLLKLFESAGVYAEHIDILTPRKKPLLLSAHQRYLAFKYRSRQPSRWLSLVNALKETASTWIRYLEKRLVSTRSIFTIVMLGIVVLPFITIQMIGQVLLAIRALIRFVVRQTLSKIAGISILRRYRAHLSKLITQPKENTIATRLYRLMEESEAALVCAMIGTRKDISAWFSPTAFWPHFNQIPTPRLMCLPDVVLSQFPVGFSQVGGNRFLENFKQVEKSIKGGEYFVTYSQDVKWRTLVERYHIDPELITVVAHGANRLDDLVVVSGFSDNDAATNALCRSLFRRSLLKAVNNEYASIFNGDDTRFIFYASQFRPNKNVLSLLKAYEYLLRRRYISYKLVLTGNPNVLPEVGAFIKEHHLENDVLCLHGLTVQELAACYRLADLAVNPSLSEGGFPFTFTEALSLGTPVAMARIPVTEEILNDPIVQQNTLFDPYDWKDMADRIEWALQNRSELLEIQRPLYDQLAQRSWRRVVDEYIAILDRIAING